MLNLFHETSALTWNCSSPLKLTDEMQGLDLGRYGDGELVLSRNGKSAITVAKFPQNVNLRHVVPNGFHKLQMGRVDTLKLETQVH